MALLRLAIKKKGKIMDKKQLIMDNVNTVLEGLIDVAKASADVAKEEAPIIFEEIIKFGIAEGVLKILLWLIPVALLPYFVVKLFQLLKRGMKNGNDEILAACYGAGIFIFGAFGLIGVFSIFESAIGVAKAILAPRLYIIEFLGGLFK